MTSGHTHSINHTHLNILWVFPLCNSNHPQKLVDVVSRVTNHASEDDQHIVHSEHSHDLNGFLLCAGHRLADQGYVAVVPRVVVHKGGTVAHT